VAEKAALSSPPQSLALKQEREEKGRQEEVGQDGIACPNPLILNNRIREHHGNKFRQLKAT